ncbi:MAG: hypothetical protein OEZ34_08610 [Spirochaetia bacterium]|nr:hypothetical protein [Spirochaetia bacterium]
MKKSSFFSILLSGMFFTIVSCGGGANVNKEWKAKNKDVDFSTAKGLVMPVDMHVGGGDLEMSAALAGGFAGASDGRWISLQPAIKLPPFNQNITHPVTSDPNGAKAKTLLAALPGFIKKAEAQVKFDFPPRFVIVAHIDGGATKTIAGKGVRAMNIRAVMYDIDQGMMVSSVNYESQMPWTGNWNADKGILIGKMTTVGKELLGKLTKI